MLKLNSKLILYSIILFGSYLHLNAQQTAIPKYLNTALSTEERVSDLVSKLSLPQKIKLMQYTSTVIDSNGIKVPAYNWWNECLHGVARAGKATVFPQAIGLAATWDTALIFKVADAISDEARAKFNFFSSKGERGIYEGLNFWTPNINIFRDPRWGRGMETYGEDPYLTGKMASSFIRGLQGNDPRYFKTIATVKHFAVHSGPESSRHRFNANVSDYDFYNTYTPAFKMAIQEAGVYSLMCAYNRFRDKPCCGSDFLLTDLLRNQWGFKGFIVTDCGAVDDFYKKGDHEVVTTPEEATAMAIKAGVDLECGNVFNAIGKAIERKLLTEAELDIAIKRLFTARFKLGFFDDASTLSFNKIPYSVVESEAHKKLALDAARKSIVLLKNSNNALPLSKSIKTIAVIGPNADDAEVMLANYHGFPSHVITPLEGLRKKLPDTKILYAKGSAIADGLPVLEIIGSDHLFANEQGTINGLNGAYFNNKMFEGEPVISRIDKKIDFEWMESLPEKSLNPFAFSVNWDGYLKVQETGNYLLDIYGSSQFELTVDDKKLFFFTNEHEPGHKNSVIKLEKNKPYKIKIKYVNYGTNPIIKLNWQKPSADLEEQAINIASKADAIVLCMGLSPKVEGEEMRVKLEGFDGGDRTKLQLPQVQQNLIKKIKALGKPVILLLVNGSAVAINWEKENIPAILESWYGGEEAGLAIADVLVGDYNPAGRLPVTFYTSENDIPAFDNYDMQGRTYRYFSGIPLFEFGFGLSYTTFKYSNLIVKENHDNSQQLLVSVTVTNTGKRDGEEVVQLYLKNTKGVALNPIESLKGFKRIALKVGEEKTINFNLNTKDLTDFIDLSKVEIIIGGGLPNKKSVSKIIDLNM